VDPLRETIEDADRWLVGAIRADAGPLVRRLRDQLADLIIENDRLRDRAAAEPTMTTYRRADGKPIGGGYSHITDLSVFDDYGHYVPVEIVEETWQLARAEPGWYLPAILGECEIEDVEPCENAAVAWWQAPDGEWLQVCEWHQPAACDGGAPQ